DRCVNELFHFREVDNFVKTGFNFPFLHSKDRAIQENILASSQFRVKACANFKQRADPAAQFAVTFGWVSDTGENLQQSALPSSVSTNYAQCLTLFDIKTDVA